MRASRNNLLFTAFLLPVLALAVLGISRPAAAYAPGPGQEPASTPQPPISTVSTHSGSLPSDAAAGSLDTSWLDACPTSPADAFGDPVFWAILGLVVLGHFVLAADFRQG